MLRSSKFSEKIFQVFDHLVTYVPEHQTVMHVTISSERVQCKQVSCSRETHAPFVQVDPFKQVGLQDIKWLNVHFREFLCMLDMMNQWCIDIANSSQVNISTPVDQVLDDHMVQRLTKIDSVKEAMAENTLCPLLRPEQMWAQV